MILIGPDIGPYAPGFGGNYNGPRPRFDPFGPFDPSRGGSIRGRFPGRNGRGRSGRGRGHIPGEPDADHFRPPTGNRDPHDGRNDFI